MGKFKQFIADFFLWTYQRGSVAYDILVVAIILFILLVPNSCFPTRMPTRPMSSKPPTTQSPQTPPVQR